MASGDLRSLGTGFTKHVQETTMEEKCAGQTVHVHWKTPRR